MVRKIKKSGILVIQLPSTKPQYIRAAHGDEEKRNLYRSVTNWIGIDSRDEYEGRYPYLPERIIDNLLARNVKISVTKWEDLNVDDLKLLIDLTFQDRESCQYDMSRKMRRNNS